MKIIEIIQRVQSLYSKGVQSQSSRLSNRHIYNKLLTVRNRLVSLQAKKKQKLNQWTYQTLDCVELIEAHDYECECLALGCKVLRTKYKLPKPLTDLNSHLIQSVTSIDGLIQINETQFGLKKYQKGNRYAKETPEWFIKDEYMYITNVRKLKVIQITGMFEDPVEAAKYPSYCKDKDEDKCSSLLDIEFPIDSELIEALIEMSVQELVVVFRQMQQDATNNSNDDNVILPNDQQQ
jgi:hypothetical protein